jgi:hypothetical protein
MRTTERGYRTSIRRHPSGGTLTGRGGDIIIGKQ